MMGLSLASLKRLGPEDAASCIASFVEALIQVDMLFLRRTPGVPLLYRSGVSYEGGEHDSPWQDVPSLLLTRKGDCKSLVAWRIAELRGQGHQALVHVVYLERAREDLFHVQVRRPDKIEDPSRFLGMRD
jgi:hypothetical protein